MAYSQSQVSAEQRAQLQEVADLLLQIYETLAEMRYLDPRGIIRGPHDISQLESVYAEHKLDPSIIYLYSILPYIDEEEAGERDFFHGGSFADFRKPDEVERGRDPFYASPSGDYDEEGGQYMRPWATPLSQLGNHGTVIIYDARLHRIWAIDQEGWSSTDPATCSERTLEGTPYEKAKSDWGGSDSAGDYEDDASDPSECSSEEWSDEGDLEAEIEQLDEEEKEGIDWDEGFEILDEDERREAQDANLSKNSMSFDHIRSRPAGDVLRDINTWYRELKELPGQGEYSSSEWREPKVLRELYARSGWPDKFDAEAFEIGQAREYCVQRAKYFAEEPQRQLDCIKGFLKYNDRDIEKWTESEATAKDDDEKWTARFQLWSAHQRAVRNQEEIRSATEKVELRSSDGRFQKEEDLPLWEMEMLRVETRWKNEALRRSDNLDSKTLEADAGYRHKQKAASTYSKAYEAAIADAKRLCPGRTFAQATGIPSLGRPDTKSSIEFSKYWMEFSRQEVEKLKEWVTQLPDGAPKTRQLVQAQIEDNQRSMEASKRRLEQQEKWLEEHGNTD